MIGSTPYNDTRWRKLWALQHAGYRGHVSCTAYYAADVYDLTDREVKYIGRFGFGRNGYEAQNFARLYTEWVTSRRDRT